MRQSDISTGLTYISSVAIILSNNILNFFDAHSAAIGAACQIIGVLITIKTYLWNKKTTTKRAEFGIKKRGEHHDWKVLGNEKPARNLQ